MISCIVAFTWKRESQRKRHSGYGFRSCLSGGMLARKTQRVNGEYNKEMKDMPGCLHPAYLCIFLSFTVFEVLCRVCQYGDSL